MFAAVADGGHLALNAPVAKASGNNYSVTARELFSAVFVGDVQMCIRDRLYTLSGSAYFSVSAVWNAEGAFGSAAAALTGVNALVMVPAIIAMPSTNDRIRFFIVI